MRKIKFRAWDKYEDGINCMIDHDHLMKHHYRKDADNIFNDDTLILMQYTGLKDKNGKEVYEGDILECPCWGGGKQNHLVEYEEFSAADDMDMGGIGFKIPFEYGTPVIIGNIYENKELLEG